MSAAFEDRRQLAELLLEHGADPGAASRDGHTPLLYASVPAHGELVRLLLEHGADPQVSTDVDAFGEVTPLMLAAGRGHLDITRDLLRHGADVDGECDVEGFGRVTPLLVAAARGFSGVVEALLEHGADRSRTDEEGRTPLTRARDAGHVEAAARLSAAPPAPRPGTERR